jgi:hypothetical protein
MYSSTAAIGSAFQSIEKLSTYRGNQNLIEAGLELTIAYELLEARQKIWSSIFWNGANAALKRRTNERMYGLVFDAMTSLFTAREALIRFQDNGGFETLTDADFQQWSKIVHSFGNAHRWAQEQFGAEVDTKQLKISTKFIHQRELLKNTN